MGGGYEGDGGIREVVTACTSQSHLQGQAPSIAALQCGAEIFH